MSHSSSASTRPLAIDSGHGYQVQADIFEPQQTPRAAIVIAPAMGANREFYYALANWLAEQGYLACAFDYYGMDRASNQKLRSNKLSVSDWATQDCVAIIDTMKALEPNAPLIWIGHSIGGQMIGMIPNRDKVAHFITVASGSGYWRLNAPQLRRKVLAFWYLVVPLAVKIYGYLPGKRLRMVGDLPRRAVGQWRRWCLNPDYLFGVESDDIVQQYRAMSMPITAIYTTDDDMMTTTGIKALHAHFGSEAVNMVELDPGIMGIPPIRHFGFFREQFSDSLWRPTLLNVIESS